MVTLKQENLASERCAHLADRTVQLEVADPNLLRVYCLPQSDRQESGNQSYPCHLVPRRSCSLAQKGYPGPPTVHCEARWGSHHVSSKLLTCGHRNCSDQLD